MIANFLVIFQIQLPGTIDGWISNNTGSTNPFLFQVDLGGFQGGGPNVIGISVLYILLFVFINYYQF